MIRKTGKAKNEGGMEANRCSLLKGTKILRHYGSKKFRVRDEKAAILLSNRAAKRADRCKEAKKHRGIVSFVEKCFGEACQNRCVTLNLIQGLSMPMLKIFAKEKPLTHFCKFASLINKNFPLPQGAREQWRHCEGGNGLPTEAIQLISQTLNQIAGLFRASLLCRAHNDSHAKITPNPLPVTNLLPSKKAAFTLAEVLITLGIIGVVAALTLPPLIQHHRKQVVAAQLKKFYSTMSQAVMTAQAEEGVQVSNWDTFSSAYNGEEMENWFNKYLKKHLKVINTKLNGAYLYVYLYDGTGFRIFNHFTGINGIHVYFYPKMKKKKPIAGVDQFTFLFYYDKFSTYMEKSSWTAQQMMSSTDNNPNGCHKNSATAHYCSTVIQRNGWKIPDDYPFRF